MVTQHDENGHPGRQVVMIMLWVGLTSPVEIIIMVTCRLIDPCSGRGNEGGLLEYVRSAFGGSILNYLYQVCDRL